MTTDDSVRQFLYVDVERVRSYLAQLDEGVLESVVDRSTDERRSRLAVNFLGINPEIGTSSGGGREEARSVQDLTFVYFERLALEDGLLSDLPDDIVEPGKWESGALHDGLAEGQVVRTTTHLQIFDPRFFAARLERMREFARALVQLQAGDALVGKSQHDRERTLAAAEKALWGGTDPSSVTHIANVMLSLMSDEIAVRVVPCGREHAHLSFGGVLLDRAGYMQKEREALFSRFGSFLSGWTVVMQIETVPYRSDVPPPDLANVSLLHADESINRAGAEKACLDLLATVDNIGLTEGPRWPSITMTPLGIYRSVPGKL